MSAYNINDAKERGLCFAFQRGLCRKTSEDCDYKHEMAKTREPSSSPKGNGKGRQGKHEKDKNKDAEGASVASVSDDQKAKRACIPCRFFASKAGGETSAITSTGLAALSAR